MSKNKNRTKFDAQGNPINSKDKKTPAKTAAPSERHHRARVERSHLAQELRDRNDVEGAENLTRTLLPHLRGRVQGLKDSHYRYGSFRTTSRRDVIQKQES